MSLPIITTIQTNINNLKSTKTDIKNAVNTDYDFIANEQIESYPGLIKQGIAYYKNRVPHATKEGTDLSFNAVPLKFENMTIKGNTEQASYEGKNLLSISDGTYTGNGYTAVVSNGKITVNGTGAYTPSAVEIPLDNPINWSANVPLVLSAFNPVAQGNTSETGNYFSLRIGSANNPNVVGAVLGNQNATASKTRTTDMEITRLQIRGYTDGEFNNFVCYPQLELNSNIGHYEPYVGGQPSPNPDYPQSIKVVTGDNVVNHVGKNLLNLTSITENTGSQSANLEKGLITISWNAGFNLDLFDIISNLDSSKTYAISFKHKGDALYLRNKKDNSTNILGTNVDSDYTTYSLNLTNINEFQFRFVRKSNTGTAYIRDIQIEQGSISTDFEPYFTPQTYPVNLGNIELCKIGDYEDILFKNVVGDENYNAELEEGVWYKKGFVEKVIFDGSETGWSISGTGTANYFYQIALHRSIMSNVSSMYANKYIYTTIYTRNTNQGFFITSDSSILRIRYGQELSLTDFKALLFEKNLLIYYVSATPIYTKITHPTLISQLEALDKAKGNNGTTIITTSGDDLAPILNFTAYLKEVE